jgi:oxygen-independent coproporphyrinogen III oxidase
MIPTSSLIKKYNVPGPRYTSYPTALLLGPVPSVTEAEKTIASAVKPGRDISIYIHLPFCRALCWYCGCNKVITRNTNDASVYLEYLEKDFRLAARTLPADHRVTQLHLGGGTPTFLTPEQLMRLTLKLQEYFTIDPDAECSVEMDPRYMTTSQVQILRGIGYNRASIGVQDLNMEVQKAIHRIQPFEQNREVTRWLRQAGFQSVNMDLIYGLPHQTPERFANTIEQILTLRPERLAIYNYAHMPHLFPAQKLIHDESLPTPDQKLQMLQYSIERLTNAGYIYIGMDHFALPDDELAKARAEGTLQRNFQGYSTRAGTEMWAFGVSAISQIGPVMVQRHKDIKTYYASLDRDELPVSKIYKLTRDDIIRRDVIMELMCGQALRWAHIDERHGIDSRQYFQAEVARLGGMIQDGLVSVDEKGIYVSDSGRLFVRNIAMVFDAWLPENIELRSYSKTV